MWKYKASQLCLKILDLTLWLASVYRKFLKTFFFVWQINQIKTKTKKQGFCFNMLCLFLFWMMVGRTLAVPDVKCPSSPVAHTCCWAWEVCAYATNRTHPKMMWVVMRPALTFNIVCYSQSWLVSRTKIVNWKISKSTGHLKGRFWILSFHLIFSTYWTKASLFAQKLFSGG